MCAPALAHLTLHGAVGTPSNEHGPLSGSEVSPGTYFSPEKSSAPSWMFPMRRTGTSPSPRLSTCAFRLVPYSIDAASWEDRGPEPPRRQSDGRRHNRRHRQPPAAGTGRLHLRELSASITRAGMQLASQGTNGRGETKRVELRVHRADVLLATWTGWPMTTVANTRCMS